MADISKKITGQIEISLKDVEKIKDVSVFEKEFASAKNSPEVTNLLKTAFGGAILLNASDVHLEPEEKKIKVRLRIDGTLQDAAELTPGAYGAVLSRIKLLASLKLNVSDRPQDGRFSVILGDNFVEIRVSSLPSEHGESLVMRILNPKELISFQDLGLRQDLSEMFEREVKKPNGMIIVTGPTGSGKTTTLYAFLKKIHNPEIKIITIEDPIEYHLAGISQTQVNPAKGYDFANGLRSIVRQDPDAILVGEIRDFETASVALQAALTGHLVLTTLHTNDAAGTIARLQALGEKAINIAPALNIVIAQRLVRKVCPKCVKLEKARPEELKKLKQFLKKIPKDAKIPRTSGCQNCNSTGYRGRVGIFEALLVDDEMENFIMTSPSVASLEEKAVKKGMITLFQDGLLKVLDGMTTIEEVERVAGE